WKKTSALEIDMEGKKGVIYFEDGEVINGEYENLVGEKAVLKLITLNRGKISVKKSKRWRKKGWMRTVDKPAENADLWEQLLNLNEKHNVEFSWVKGHAGNRENERCDRLASQAAGKKKNLSRDTAYETGQTKVTEKRTFWSK
ncbi:unnamed protein product, partial [marine sediment metagenome]